MPHEIWLNKQSNLTFLIFAVSQTKELAQKASYRLNTAQRSYIVFCRVKGNHLMKCMAYWQK